MLDMLIGMIMMGAIWFAYVCGKTDCKKNSHCSKDDYNTFDAM